MVDLRNARLLRACTCTSLLTHGTCRAVDFIRLMHDAVRKVDKKMEGRVLGWMLWKWRRREVEKKVDKKLKVERG